MHFDFETLAPRQGIGNMKAAMQEKALPGTVVLSGAELDFATAPVIRKAVADFAMNGLYGYTKADGPYRQSICWWMKRVRGYEIQPNQIVTTLGTVFALNTALRAFTKEGDGVILQHPSYFKHDRAIEHNGRHVVANPLKEEKGVYSIDWADLEEKMAQPENTMMVLCNPHNPTAKVFHEDELRRIAQLAEKYNVLVFSDEIFAETAQPGHDVRPYVEIDPKHGMTATSLGKAFSFTGVNHANMLIPNDELRERYRAQRIKDHFGSIDPFFYCALRAGYSEEGWQWVQAMNENTRKNYDMLAEAFAEKMPLLSLSPLEGSFICWMDLRKLNLNKEEQQKFLVEEVKLVTDDGEEYGPWGRGFVRLNLGTTPGNIKLFLSNLEAAYKQRGF